MGERGRRLKEWVPTWGHSKYSCSTLGQIRNNRRDRILKQTKSRSGYMIVDLGGKTMLVAGLVLRSFTGEPYADGYYVAWRDDDRSNNSIDNLMWAGPRTKKW